MEYVLEAVVDADREALVALRIDAMKKSLENIGRFDPQTARVRFLKRFEASDTKKIMLNNELAGFYVLKQEIDYLHLDHFYIHPNFQNQKLGHNVMQHVKQQAQKMGFPIRLGALKDSRSNAFYLNQGFEFTHAEEWDNYYELLPSS